MTVKPYSFDAEPSFSVYYKITPRPVSYCHLSLNLAVVHLVTLEHYFIYTWSVLEVTTKPFIRECLYRGMIMMLEWAFDFQETVQVGVAWWIIHFMIWECTEEWMCLVHKESYKGHTQLLVSNIMLVTNFWLDCCGFLLHSPFYSRRGNLFLLQ